MTAALAEMAVLRGAECSIDTLELYAAGLKVEGLPVEDVEAACVAHGRRPREQGELGFPEFGKLLKLIRWAGQERRARVRALGSGDDGPLVRCAQCLDDPQGWILLECPGWHCGRPQAHAAHGFAVRCPHWLRQQAETLQIAAREALQSGRSLPSVCRSLSDLEAGVYPWRTARTRSAREAAAREQRQAEAGIR